VALVDDEDYERVMQYKWYAQKEDNNKYYAQRRITISKNSSIIGHLHRFIMNPQPWEEVDHINNDGLDNRRCNLRIVTHGQNMMNQRKQKRKTSSIYKGVSWRKDLNDWVSNIMINQNQKYLGRFHNEEDAARTYDKAAKKLFGEFACLNFKDQLKNI
jgi:hypothetical protein